MLLHKFTGTTWYRAFPVTLGMELIADVLDAIWPDRSGDPLPVRHPSVHEFDAVML